MSTRSENTNLSDLIIRKMEEKGAILENGTSSRGTYACVARELGIHHSTVKNIWSRFVSYKSLEPAPRSGRPMKLQYADLEYIKCLKTERPSLTHAEVRDKLEENANISIDVATVCRAVKRKLDPVEWTRMRLVTPAGQYVFRDYRKGRTAYNLYHCS